MDDAQNRGVSLENREFQHLSVLLRIRGHIHDDLQFGHPDSLRCVGSRNISKLRSRLRESDSFIRRHVDRK